MVQGDTNSRKIEVSLFSDGSAWNVPDGSSVSLRYKNGNGDKGNILDIPYEIEKNVVSVTIESDILIASGESILQIVLLNGEHSLSIFSIAIDVQEDPSM
jgi:hypothetical protein